MTYKVLRCPECRTRRVDAHLMVKHRLKCNRPLCHCLAGATYPHRPGSTRFCDANPLAGMFLALMHGATNEEATDIAIEISLTQPGRAAVACPF